MELKLDIIEGERRREAFSNPVVSWKYRITTGPRCPGLVSHRNYKSVDAAMNAGERMFKKLCGA